MLQSMGLQIDTTERLNNNMLPAHFLPVEKLKSKNKFNQRSEKMQKEKKENKGDQITIM